MGGLTKKAEGGSDDEEEPGSSDGPRLDWLHRAWAVAVFDLGIRPGEFWDLTMGDFLLLSYRRQEQLKWEDLNVSRVLALIRNTNRRREDSPVYSVRELMITTPQPKPTPKDPLAVIRRMEALAERMNGQNNNGE